MEKAQDFRVVCITTPSLENAFHIAKVLVNEKLAASSTIIPNIITMIGWSGQIKERHENKLQVVTTADKLDVLEQRVMEMHTDEMPEILTLQVGEGHGLYLEWIKNSLIDY